jgi:hypothetical protein
MIYIYIYIYNVNTAMFFNNDKQLFEMKKKSDEKTSEKPE